jgi:Uma2 family endonuclease
MAEVLQTVSSTKAKMSWEEFLSAGEEWQRWELVDEEVEFMSPTGTRHGKVISNLDAELHAYCKSHQEWINLGPDTAFTMASGNWRCPDAALVRASRYPGRKIPEGPTDFPPDVAFEVYSPADSAARVAQKRRDYQASGVIQVWIDPEKRQAEVVYPDGASRYFNAGQPLVIDRLESFSLDLKALFNV